MVERPRPVIRTTVRFTDAVAQRAIGAVKLFGALSRAVVVDGRERVEQVGALALAAQHTLELVTSARRLPLAERLRCDVPCASLSNSPRRSAPG